MKVIALVGGSGTGKSHKALLIAHKENIEYIIDDGLLIKKAIISTENSKVAVLVIPTNEELMIARDTAEICNNLV